MQGGGVDPGGEDVEPTFGERLFLAVRRGLPVLFVAAAAGIGALFYFAEPPRREGAEAEGSRGGTPVPEETARSVADGSAAEEPGAGGVFSFAADNLRREPRLREVLAEERGGRVALTERRSLKMTGTLAAEGREFPAILLAGFPDRGVLRILREGEIVTIGRNGPDVWKTVQPEGEARRRAEMTPFDLVRVDVLRRIHGPLLGLFLRGAGRVVSVEETHFEAKERSVIRVTFHRPESAGTEEVDLDPRDLRLLRWEFGSEEGGGVTVVHYDGHVEVDKILHPAEIEIWRDGELATTFSADEIEANFGAVGLFFEAPVVSKESPGAREDS